MTISAGQHKAHILLIVSMFQAPVEGLNRNNYWQENHIMLNRSSCFKHLISASSICFWHLYDLLLQITVTQSINAFTGVLMWLQMIQVCIFCGVCTQVICSNNMLVCLTHIHTCAVSRAISSTSSHHISHGHHGWGCLQKPPRNSLLHFCSKLLPLKRINQGQLEPWNHICSCRWTHTVD